MGLRQIVGQRADGQEIELEGTLSQVVIHQQLVMIASLRDVTQRNLADLNLERAQTQLQALTRRLMAQERMLVKGMAQVLHDHLGQTIAAIRMAHETILTLQGESIPPKITQLQSQLDKLVGSAVQQVRQVLGDLRPPLLEQQGLIAALDNELRNRSLTHATIDISIHVPPDIAPLRWPGEVEVAAFMVAREAVENAIRHAQASHVSVWLEGSALSLQVSVTDDGVGVNTASALPTAHLDLLSMRERAHAVGAALALDSISTGGTRVSFNWQDAP
jgi:signal transduction histidine kinase